MTDGARETIEAAIRAAFHAFNAGHMAAFRASWANDVRGIVNEAPPHVRSGPGAVDRWLADSARGDDGTSAPPHIALRRVLKILVGDERAFAVLAVTVTAGPADNRIEDEGVQISVLVLIDGRWRVEALAYGGGLTA